MNQLEITQEYVTFQSQTQLVNLAQKVATSRSKTKPAILQAIQVGTQIRLGLEALNYSAFLTKPQIDEILYLLSDIASINGFPFAPTVTSATIPEILLGLPGPVGPAGPVGPTGGGLPFLVSNVSTDQVIDSFPITLCGAAEWTYDVHDATNKRVERLIGCWLPDGSQFRDDGGVTLDPEIGVTSGISFYVNFVAGNIQLIAHVTSGTWTVAGSRVQIPVNGNGVILPSSLTNGTIWIGSPANTPAEWAVTGDISLSNAGVASINPGVIVNADINASAAIDLTKLAALPPLFAVVTDGAGFLTTSVTTATQIGYLSNVTSDVQAQINSKLTVNLGAAATGDILYFNGIDWTNFPRGTAGQVLSSTAGTIAWMAAAGSAAAGADTQIQFNQAGAFGANANFIFKYATNQFVGGTGSTAPAGSLTFTFGDTNANSGTFGSAMFGELSIIDPGVGSAFASGESVWIRSYGGKAFGRGSRVNTASTYSFIGGAWIPGSTNPVTNNKVPQTGAFAAFGWYSTDAGQTDFDGVNAAYSVILGGTNHNIPSSSTHSVVLGGIGIKARAADPSQVYVPNFNIGTLPLNDNALTNILVRDPATGQIKYRTSGSLSSGITNTAANTELMRSDGTNAVPSGLFVTSLGNIDMGTGLAGIGRDIFSNGSGTDIDLNMKMKGQGDFQIYTNTSSLLFTLTSQGIFNFYSPGRIQTINAAAPSDPLIIQTGDPASGNSASGALTLKTGNPQGSGAAGSVNIFTGTIGTGSEGAVNIQTSTGLLGFFGATAVVKASAVTTAQGIADVLTAYGLLPTSTISGGGGGWSVSGATTITGNTSQVGNFTNTSQFDSFIITPNVKTGVTALSGLVFNGPAHTNLTAGTEFVDINLALNRIVQFATGAIPTQRSVYLRQTTYAFVGPSTITDAYGLYVEAPAQGVNATLTNSWGLGLLGGIKWNTSANLYIAPSSGVNNANVDNTGTKLVLSSGASTLQNGASILLFPGSTTVNATGNAGSVYISSAVAATSSTSALYGLRLEYSANQAATAAGDLEPLRINLNLTNHRGNTYVIKARTTTNAWGRNTGAETFTGYEMGVSFNQTTGATGDIQGFYHNPNITSVAGNHYSFRSASGSVLLVQDARAASWTSAIKSTAGAHTGLTAGAEFVSHDFVGSTQQWATGALATQRFNLFRAYTVGFVAASTLTTAATLAVTGAPNAGTNATITTSTAILVSAATLTTSVTNGYGLIVNAPTGATNNFAANFIGGNVVVGNLGDGTNNLRYIRANSAGVLSNEVDILVGPTGKYMRSAHETGYLEGGNTNIGSALTYTNPIFVLGSQYAPAPTTLGTMYGIGFSSTGASGASFLTAFNTYGNAWGLYVTSAGVARIFLDSNNGTIHSNDIRLITLVGAAAGYARLDANGKIYRSATFVALGTSSAPTLTLDTATQTNVFTGSTAATWTLPPVAGNTDMVFFVKNRGTAVVTLQADAFDNLYTTTTAPSIVLNPGDAFIIQNDGTYWIVM